MRMSKMLLRTLREVPSDSEITSHKLMLRSGMINRVALGTYNQLPMGMKVFRKIENIVREELEEKGCQEVLCSSLTPFELYQQSGRCNTMGEKMFKLMDINGNNYYLGSSNEEVFTDIIRQEVVSYKQLPLNIYRIGTEYRNETGHKLGIVRTKSFTMKEGYSFDTDEVGLDTSYQDMYYAYTSIFKRCCLNNNSVEAYTSDICGSKSAKFVINSEIGEDEIVFCDSCAYAATMEKAISEGDIPLKEDMKELNLIHTPSISTIADLEKYLSVKANKFAKTLIYEADEKTVVVVVRGDREVNEVKVCNSIGKLIELKLAREEVVNQVTGAGIGFAGPIGIRADYVFIDKEVAEQNNIYVGANKTDYHIQNANYGRDFDGIVGDFRKVQQGDRCTCGGYHQISKGIEIGHISKLGTRYSEAMKATYIDKDGKQKPMFMGSYRIGIERIISAIIEQHHDDNGIIWPLSVAPYHVVIVPVNMKKEEHVEISQKIYKELKEIGLDVLLDDRSERVGVKFKDSELLGIPIRITVGKDISEGLVEFKLREEEEKELVKLEDIKLKIESKFIKEKVKL